MTTCSSFALEGDIPGFLSSRCAFLLTVHSDGSLTGTITPIHCNERAVTDDTYSLFDGIATPCVADKTLRVSCYVVTFQIVKLCDLPGVVFYIDIEGELSTTRGLLGRWNVSGSLGRPGALEPDRPIHISSAVAPEILVQKLHVDSTLDRHVAMYPLTQGIYTLRGATIADNGYMYRATWTLQLRPGGILEGTSQENDNAPQLCRLEGSWTRTHIHLVMHYVMENEMGTYHHDGDVRGGGLRGRCINIHYPNALNERGNFEFVCVEARRQWNLADHCLYPPAFQHAVQTCLLTSSHHHHRLPSRLWQEVFAYCAYDWFDVNKG